MGTQHYRYLAKLLKSVNVSAGLPTTHILGQLHQRVAREEQIDAERANVHQVPYHGRQMPKFVMEFGLAQS